MAERIIATGNTAAFVKLAQGIPRDFRLSQHGSLFTQNFEPEFMELARTNQLYACNNGSAVGLANVAAIPTTTASYGLYNNHATKSLVVIKVAATATTVTSPLDFALIVGLPQTPQAAAETKYANSLAGPLGASGDTTPGGYLTDAVTLAATPIWQTVAHYGGNNGLLGAAAVAWLKGMYVVPPKYCLGIDIVGSAGTTPLYDVDCVWAEMALDLG